MNARNGSGRFPRLLEPGRIGTLEVRNRILMCPMGDNLAQEDGCPSETSMDYFEARARGGVGLILVGSVAVSWPEGSYNPNQSALSDDRMIPAFAELANRVHRHGAKIAAQLSHGGVTAVNDIRDGRPLWVPSAPKPGSPDPLMGMVTPDEQALQSRPMRAPTAKVAIHEMTKDDIRWLVGKFADAAERARRAGLDGVEVHAGHGYVLSSFLSPAKNRRTDEYGGSTENRVRILVEVLEAIRARVGRDFPVWCRVDSIEFDEPNGITPELACDVARAIEAAGGDAIHASANGLAGSALTYTKGHTTHEPSGLLELASTIKKAVGIPVIAVGRIEPEAAEEAIAAGRCDFVAMGRKLLADPELPKRLAEGRAEDVRPCMYHYTCISQIFLREPVRCMANPSTGREAELEFGEAKRSRRVLVVGGGPAGLEVARIAALRGHAVRLYEREDRLGGRLALAAETYDPNRRMFEWLVRQVGALPIDVRLGASCDERAVEEWGAEVVVLATGGLWPKPSIPGGDAAHVATVDDLRAVFEGRVELGARIAILGGGRAACGLADRFVRRGHAVTILEPSGVFAAQMGLPGRWRIVHELRELGVTLVPHAKVEAIEEAAVRWLDAEGATQRTDADHVVVTTGATASQPDFASKLVGPGGQALEVHRVGDCAEIGFVRGALESAVRIGRAL
ncbi:MAG: FAD-dependent oxidoreductase [Myxococcota bacterium]